MILTIIYNCVLMEPTAGPCIVGGNTGPVPRQDRPGAPVSPGNSSRRPTSYTLVLATLRRTNSSILTADSCPAYEQRSSHQLLQQTICRAAIWLSELTGCYIGHILRLPQSYLFVQKLHCSLDNILKKRKLKKQFFLNN